MHHTHTHFYTHPCTFILTQAQPWGDDKNVCTANKTQRETQPVLKDSLAHSQIETETEIPTGRYRDNPCMPHSIHTPFGTQRGVHSMLICTQIYGSRSFMHKIS